MSNPLRRLVLMVAGSCAICALGACSGVKAATQSTESISVRELNIVDEHGQARIRIGAPLPDPKGLKRIVIGVENGVASVVLSDAQGNPHMRLEVDKDGKTRVEGVTPSPTSK